MAQYLGIGTNGKNGPIGVICGQNAGKISNQVAKGLVVWIQPNNSVLALAFLGSTQCPLRVYRGPTILR